jgi:hypothetical protein
MARTIQEIKNGMTATFVANDTIKSLYGLEDGQTFDECFSAVSLESVLFYVVSVSVWALEQMFDAHKTEITSCIDTMKPHSLRWYAGKATDFEYGYDLPADSDRYDNTGLTDEQVEAAKIVAYAAAMEVETGVRLRVAKDAGDDLAPLSAQELKSFSEYMARVKDAGVRLFIASNSADTLSLTLKIYYNPLVLILDAGGRLNRADGTAADVVIAAVKNYLKNLPFNGVLVLAYLVDALQQVEGIVIPHVVSASAQYAQVTTPFDVKYAPNAGYIRLDETACFVTGEAQSVI